MKITLKWLKEKNACQDAVDAWKAKGKEPDPIKVVGLAMKMNRFDWANWLIVRCMTYKTNVSYAVFAAEQVIDIYEKKYPNDARPRKAIEAARACIADPSKKNKDTVAYTAAYTAAAHAAAYAADAYAAAYAAYAAAYAAYAAADVADAYAAYAAAYADAAAYAAAYAAYAAYAAAAATRKQMQKKIIEYGITLLEQRRS